MWEYSFMDLATDFVVVQRTDVTFTVEELRRLASADQRAGWRWFGDRLSTLLDGGPPTDEARFFNCPVRWRRLQQTASGTPPVDLSWPYSLIQRWGNEGRSRMGRYGAFEHLCRTDLACCTRVILLRRPISPRLRQAPAP